jgi:putative oxidoreductase
MVLPWSDAAPLAGWMDLVLLGVRAVTGITMIYYGWPKVRDPKKNAAEFDTIGFRPGWLFGTLVLLAEFGGGLLILVGIYTWVGAALIAIHMTTGAMWKIASTKKPFPDWSYDLLIAALCLGLLATGPGAFRPA